MDARTTCRIVATYEDGDGTRCEGAFDVVYNRRAVGSDGVTPAGKSSVSGTLSTTAPHSLDAVVRAMEPGDGSPAVVVRVRFDRPKRKGEVFYLYRLPVDGLIDLTDYVPEDVGPDAPGGGGGAAIVSIELVGDILTMYMDDGRELHVTFPLPQDGRGVEMITAQGETATITYTDGATDTIALPTGPPGPQGDTGPKGDRGDQGEQGPQGDPGPKGDTGDTGDQGPQGPQGEQGAQGPQGEQGLQGDPGPQGDQGDTGDQGPAGRDVTSIVADASGLTATVTYSDGATASLSLPPGPKGDQGEQGDTGDQGPQGIGVTSIVADTGGLTATITYSDGATASLSLPPGPKGDPGDQGPQGVGISNMHETVGVGGGKFLEVVLTDGQYATFELPQGPQGDPGPEGPQGPPGVIPEGLATEAWTMLAISEHTPPIRVVTAYPEPREPGTLYILVEEE